MKYKLSRTIKKINIKDYIANYRNTDRFIIYCKECGNYNACWACPPFNFDTEKYISSYKIAYIIGTKVVIDADVIKQNTGQELCTKVSYQIIKEIRLKLDNELLELETRFPESKAFFAGTCHNICHADKCTRTEGKLCTTPDKVRPSLEAFGFDISKTSSELLNIEMKWSHNGILPEYLTLVSGFFTNNEIELI